MKPDYSPVRRWSLALLTVLFAFAFASAAHAQLTFGSTTYSGTGTSIAKGDINNDGFVDLFVVDEFNLQGRIYINNGSGGLIGPTFPNGPFFPRTGGLADLNGDGNLDILGPDGSRVWIEFGNG